MTKYKVKVNFWLDDNGYWWFNWAYKLKGGWEWADYDVRVNNLYDGTFWMNDMTKMARETLKQVYDYLETIEEIEEGTVLDLEVEA